MYGPLIEVQIPYAIHLLLIGLLLVVLVFITCGPLHTLYDRWRRWSKRFRPPK